MSVLITKSIAVKKIKEVLYGSLIGASMLIPGLSGGTAAIILGIYDKLTESAGNILKTPKKSLAFLIPVGTGGIIGAVLFSGAVLAVIEKYYTLSMFFFIGAITGTLPMLVRQSGISLKTLYNAVFALFGTAAAVCIRFIPAVQGGTEGFLLTALCGFIIAIGMVLPGISTSHLLLVLGMYERVWGSLKDPDIVFLFPLMIGGAAGTVLTAKLTAAALKKYPAQSYMIIIGFVMSSVYDIFPENFDNSAVIQYILLCAAGFAAVYFITINTENL